MKQIIFISLVAILLFGCKEKNETQDVINPKDNKFLELTSILDTYVEDKLKKGNVNSFALAVYKDGETYQKYYGVIDKASNKKPNDSSLYEIASITKTFTGALVAKAVLAKKISLDDDIRMYFEGDYSNLEFEGNPITIKHLLTHTLGLKEKTPPKLEAFNDKMNSGIDIDSLEIYTIQDLLDELKYAQVDKKPGTVFSYNSVGPELLAYILERVNKQPFNQQINDFFKEIGMTNTYLQDSQNYKENLVKGYDGQIEAVIDYCPIYGAAGGAIATLPDLAKYMEYLIKNKESPWVKEASRVLFTNEEEGEQIGYLWQNIGFAEEEGYFYSKTGTSNGTQSGVLICPDSNYGITLIVNNTSDASYNDWVSLFFYDIEPDIIKYPKINLFASIKSDFQKNIPLGIKKFEELKKDTTNYYVNINSINNFGYQLLSEQEIEKAISVFKFILEEYPDNSNAYDSLGEAYFINQDFEKALLNYKKSLELNPRNDNAKNYIERIEKKIEK